MKISLAQLGNDVRNFHLKAAGHGGTGTVSETDARASAAAAAGKTDGDATDKLGLPATSKPENAAGDLGVAAPETKPSGTGENVPAVSRTTKPDELSTEKYAKAKTAAANTLAWLKEQGTKSAAAPGAAAAPAASAAPAAAAGSTAAPASKEANTNLADAPPEQIYFLAKVAHAILSTKEGIAEVERLLTKQAGAQEVATLIKNACEARDHYVRAAALEEMQMKQAAQQQALIKEAFDKLTPEEQQLSIKIASVHDTNIQNFGDDLFLAAHYKMGAMDAGAMQAAMGGGGEPMIPGGDGKPTMEQILDLLMQMVSAGELDPAVAQGIAEQLASGGGDPAAGGMPPGDPAAAGAGAPGGGVPPEVAAAMAAGGGGGAPGGGAPPAEGGGGGGAPPEKKPEGEGKEKEASADATMAAVFAKHVGAQYFTA